MSEFDRYHPAMGVYFLVPATMAAGFLYTVLSGGSPIRAETYGSFVYAIPAWVWCVAQLSICLAASASAFIGWPRIHAATAFLTGCLMLFFSASAVYGRAEEVIIVWAGIPAAAVCLLSAWIGWEHGR